MLLRRLPTVALVTTLTITMAACDSATDPPPPPPPMTGEIAGTVVDDLDDGIAGITVHLREPGTGSDLETRTTSASGGYTFADIEAGSYEIELDTPDDHVLDGGTNPRSVNVAASSTATADFALRLLAGEVTGSVLASGSGDGVLDVDVSLSQAGSGASTRTAQTDANGDYGFDRVPIGDWDIAFSAPPATQLESPETVPVTVADQSESMAAATLELLPVSLSTHVQPVLTSRCTACHVGAGAPDGLELTDGLTHSETVNVAAVQLPSMDRIEPGAPDASYLVHKIQGTQASVGGVAGRMPLGQEPLRAHLIEMIRRWTAEGAPDN